LNALGGDAVPIEAHDREVLRSTYDAGVGYLDASLGALFEVLRSSGAWDRMLVVVTSDHGEEFMEHGGFSHGTLHDEILRVPLLIKWPGAVRAGSGDETATSSIDLAPTLLESAGLPRDDLPGVVLGRRPAGQPVFAGTLTRAVVAGGFKGIFGGPKGSREVYDLAEDPSERHNLAASNPGKAAELEELLAAQQREAWALFGRMSKDGGAREVQLSEQERDRLKAFGYVDGGDGE
jgi:arylsulfatase A-like enzyme